MTKMTGGQALVKSLRREGALVIFGMPGVQIYHAMDALYGESGIRFITTRHEQGAAYMAYGYSAAGGGIGTALVVPGPGLLNAAAAIGTAYAASTPVLLVSGQIPSDLIGVNRGVLHEVDDQLDAIRPVTKWASRVTHAADVPEAVHEAFFHLNTGRPRPVEIEIPQDTLGETADVELREPGAYEPLSPDPGAIVEGARTLAGAARPLIWVGGGAVSSGASEVLQRVAEHLQAPVVSTPEGKGAISDRHYLSMGVPHFRSDLLDRVIKESDVVLAVGTRLASAELGDGQRVVQIDVDDDEIGRNHSNTLSIVGDARRSLDELYRALSAAGPVRMSRRLELEGIKSTRFGPSAHVEPQGSLTRAIRAAMPDDGILVEDMTQIGYYCRVFYPVYAPRTYIASSYFGNLGFAYPTALGAKVAQPDRAVVAISGDGGFLFNSQELATAVMHGINVVVIVFNDSALGNVLRDQKNMFGGRTIGAELHNPDFVKLAEAYGGRGVRVEGAERLESALREALSIDAPTLIEVPVGVMPQPW